MDEKLLKDILARESSRIGDTPESLQEKAVQLRKDGKLELAIRTEKVAERLMKSGATYATMCIDLLTDEDFEEYLSGVEAVLNNMKRYGLSFEEDEKRLRLAERTAKSGTYN